MDFESVRVAYCCKTVSRLNFWRKDFIVKMSLFVYTHSIFAINITSVPLIHKSTSDIKMKLVYKWTQGNFNNDKFTIQFWDTYHLHPHFLHFQLLPASLIAPNTPNAAVFATFVPAEILDTSTDPQVGHFGNEGIPCCIA